MLPTARYAAYHAVGSVLLSYGEIGVYVAFTPSMNTYETVAGHMEW